MWRTTGQFYGNKAFSSAYQGRSEVVHIVLLPIGAMHGWSVVTETEKKWEYVVLRPDRYSWQGRTGWGMWMWSLQKKMDLNNFSYYAGLCDLLRL